MLRAVFIIAFAFLAAGAALADRSANTASSQFASDAEKVAFLQRYLKPRSPIEATEFHIVFHDNSGGLVPGPSDWTILAAIKIDPADIPRWTANRQPADAATMDPTRWKGILPSDGRWALQSSPRAYRSGADTVLLVYEREGIILFRSATN